VFVNPAAIPVLVHVYDVEPPTARPPRFGRAHPATAGSVVATFVNGSSPIFVTVIVHVVDPPGSTIVGDAVFVTSIRGTCTTVVSESPKAPSRSDLESTTASFTNAAVAGRPVHVYVNTELAAGATPMFGILRAHPGANASVTKTCFSATPPALVTVIVKVGMPPTATVCSSSVPLNDLSILIAALGTDSTAFCSRKESPAVSRLMFIDVLPVTSWGRFRFRTSTFAFVNGVVTPVTYGTDPPAIEVPMLFNPPRAFWISVGDAAEFDW
jgi:hypothetical protein